MFFINKTLVSTGIAMAMAGSHGRARDRRLEGHGR
jgi:hypothetical protein